MRCCQRFLLIQKQESEQKAAKFWYGFKKNVAVDIQSGTITEVTVTAANLPDAKAVHQILPKSGAVVGDKGYLGALSKIFKKGLHPMIIKGNKMKDPYTYKANKASYYCEVPCFDALFVQLYALCPWPQEPIFLHRICPQ